MRDIGGFSFPEQGNYDEALAFEPKIMVWALDRQVLVVAKTRVEGAWKAYCGAVPGQNHDLEKDEVLHHGATVPEHIARAIWGFMEDVPYAP